MTGRPEGSCDRGSGNAEGSVIELLPLFEPRIHAVKGRWEFADGVLSLAGAAPHSRVALPYLPPEEYDFRVVFAPENRDPVDVLLVYNRIDFFFEISPKIAAFAMMNGKPPADKGNPSRATAANFFPNEAPMLELCLKVRSYRVSAFLNGIRIVDRATDYRDVGMDPGWRLPLPVLGIGGFNALARFHSLTVKEVLGRGLVLPGSAFHRPCA